MAFSSILFSPLPFKIPPGKSTSTCVASPTNTIRCCDQSTLKFRDASSNGSASSAERFPEKQKPSPSSVPRPRRIILVRHGQSVGNVDESIYTMVPDSRIDLTEKGRHEAEECGRRIRAMIESDGADDWKVYFYVSPYVRTIETLRGLGRAFDRERILGVREEPRLREQDFGSDVTRLKQAQWTFPRVRLHELLGCCNFFYRSPWKAHAILTSDHKISIGCAALYA
ncbi:hypothetical protein ACLOJK_032255 [Asimina triloba]